LIAIQIYTQVSVFPVRGIYKQSMEVRLVETTSKVTFADVCSNTTLQ